MKLKIIFGKHPIKWFELNYKKTTFKEVIKEYHNTNNTVLSYKFNDLPLTKKFIKYWLEYMHMTNAKNGINNIEYITSYYPEGFDDLFQYCRRQMNIVLSELKSLGYHNITDEMYMVENEFSVLQGSEIEKLNSLHFFFETEMYKLKKVNTAYENINLKKQINLLDQVNELVHFLEKTNTIVKNQQWFINIKQTPPNGGISYKLLPKDYKDFTNPVAGDLILDYATVGKDLNTAFVTNDVELIKNNEVKQQEYLTNGVSITFYDKQENNYEEGKKRYYEWCATNNVDKYFDYTQPKYNPGRHVLGKIEQNLYTAEDFNKKVFKVTPCLLGMLLTDDNDNIEYEWMSKL